MNSKNPMDDPFLRSANAPAQDDALQLAVVEPTRLEQLEAIVEQHVQGFVAVASALWEIRRDELYKERGFRSFEVYIRERWQGFEANLSQSYLSRLCIAGTVLENIQNTTDVDFMTNGHKTEHTSTKNTTGAGQQTILPSNERQMRELARAPEEMQGAVWERAQELARAEAPPGGKAAQFHVPGRVAARHVEAARNELLPIRPTYRHDNAPAHVPKPEPPEELPATFENFQSAVYEEDAKVWLITAHVQELNRDVVIPVPAHCLRR